MESYNIYNLLSFSIKRSGYLFGILRKFNPEYIWFDSTEESEQKFVVVVSRQREKGVKYSEIKYKRISWYVSISKEGKKVTCYVSPKDLGLRFLMPYLTLKNLYVRSLVMFYLLESDAALLHSCGFVYREKAIILAGRPGVFKTSILMDAIRRHNGLFLGEENTLVKDGVAYPFPLNHSSVSFKIKNYKDENAAGLIQKARLGINLISSYYKGSNTFRTPVAKPTSINAICHVTKGDCFSIRSVELEEVLNELIENEILEIDFPPTHSLSGIKRNEFSSIISTKEFYDFKDKIEQVLRRNLVNARCYQITTPLDYELHITDRILEEIK